MKENLHINALLTRAGVNMGDHAQDVTTAIVLDPEMTIREMCEKHLTRETWIGLNEPKKVEPDADRHVIIRLAVEATK
jgi:hypothetical protein